MDCLTNAPPDLLRYHLGALDDEEQERVDAHLLGCPGCLQAYLRLRRAIAAALPADEGAAPDGDAMRPSRAARARLRAAVAQRFRPSRAERARRLLARPLPLYQAAALLLMVVGGLLAALPPQRAPWPRDPGAWQPVAAPARCLPPREAPDPDEQRQAPPRRRPPPAVPEAGRYLEAVDTSRRSAPSPVVL